MSAAVYFGSRGLRNFDAALIGYATATIFLAFGVTYRYAVWIQSSPARRYLIQGWKAFLSWRNFRRFPALVPRALISNLALQSFIRERGVGRWVAHQAVFWGVIGATLITFPLAFGWIHFRSAPGTESGYVMYVFGLETVTFDALTWLGWLTFHGLDVTAVLVIAGCAYFLWRRFHDREAMTGQHLGQDLLPLVALVAISVTGPLLSYCRTAAPVLDKLIADEDDVVVAAITAAEFLLGVELSDGRRRHSRQRYVEWSATVAPLF